MENPTAFNLNLAIQRWRDALAQSPSFRPEDLDELETHLRDSVTAFGKGALSEEEAFFIAVRRLGGGTALEPEFAKVNHREVWTNRLLWMLTGILLWGLVGTVSHLATEIGEVAAMLGFGYHPSVSQGLLPGLLFAAVQMSFLVASLLVCKWFLPHAGGRLAKVIADGVQRPFRLITAAVAISLVLVACQGVSWFEPILLSRQIGPESFGALAYSRSIGAFVIFPLQTLALVSAALLLARRQLQRNLTPPPLPVDLSRH